MIPATEEQLEELRLQNEAQEEFLRKIEAERAEGAARKKAADEIFEKQMEEHRRQGGGQVYPEED